MLQREFLDPEDEGLEKASAMSKIYQAWMGIDAQRWVELYQEPLAQRLGELLVATPIQLSPFGANWTAAGYGRFAAKLGRDLIAPPSTWQNLDLALGRGQLNRAVDVGRDSYPAAYGPPTWEPAVATEILARLAMRVDESIGRVLDRVGAYEMSRNSAAVPAAGVASSPGAAAAGASAPPSSAAFAYPIDPFVFAALLDNVTFDWRHALALLTQPAQASAERPLRRVSFVFQASYGASAWLRVVDPPDATVFEVAYELFGDLTSAHLLVDAHPLYGFREGYIGDYSPTLPELQYLRWPGARPEHRAAYEAAVRAARLPAPPVGTESPSPMQQVLTGRLGDEVSLRTAPPVATTPAITPAVISQRFALICDRFAQIVAIAPPLARRDPIARPLPSGYMPLQTWPEAEWETRLRVAAERVRTRATRLAGSSDDRQLLLWDAQTAGQLKTLNAAMAGLSVAAALRVNYFEQPRIYSAITDVASRYVAAAEISDAYTAAQQQLDAADRQSQLFPVTAMELMLADLRATIDAARFSKIKGENSNESRYGISYLDRTERQLRERLARIRPVLLSAPDQAKDELRAVNHELAALQTGVGLVGNLDAIDAVMQALMDSLSWSGEFRALFGHYGNDKVEDAIDGALKLYQDWQRIYAIWAVDEPTARGLLRAKAETKEWQTWFANMRELIHDQAQADAWTKFGFMVGIALVTAGIGTYVEAAAGATWGALAATGAEAVSFTSMSYLILEKDPSVSGFFEQLGVNFLTFGALRFVSLGYRGLLGPTKAATPIGKLGEIGTQFVALNGVALAEANYVKQRDTGTSLTQEEIVAISLQNLGFVGAMTLGTFLLKSPLVNLSLEGELAGANYRVRRAAAALESTVGKAKAIEAAGGRSPAKLRETLVSAEDAYIEAERDLLLALGRSVRRANKLSAKRGAKLLARLGVSEPLARAVSTGEASQQLQAHIDALTAVQVQRALAPAGGGDFLVAGEKFDMVLEYFRSQGIDVVASQTTPSGGKSGLRLATIRVPGEPIMRVLESSTAEPSSVLGSEQLLDTPFAQSQRHTRMRAIARIILESRVVTARTDPRAKQAKDVTAAMKEIRTPFHAKEGDPPPPLEAYVPDFAVPENIRAVAEIRAKLLRDNPDVIVGMERYGSLFADMLAYGHPELQAKLIRFEPVRWDTATSPGTGPAGKFDPQSIQGEFRTILGADKATGKTVAVVDSYMGGSTTESLLNQVYKVLAKEYPNARFRNYVIRETSGFKISQDGKAVLPEVRGQPSKTSPSADLVHTEVEEVSIIVGDDVARVYDLESSEPVRIFDSSGKVVEMFVPKPGQTTRQVLVEIMNGQYAAQPPRPIPDPVGPVHGRLPSDRDEPKVPDQPATVLPVVPVP